MIDDLVDTQTADTEPNVSVVMIAWSPSDYRMRIMRQSFASFKAHTQRPHLLIVVDNGPAEQTNFLNSQSINVHIVNPINLGVGKSRNLGASASATEYIAFVDNDLGYFDGWLNATIETLERYPNERLVATAVKNHPMKYAKNRCGHLDDYDLYSRCAGMCMVMRRTDYDAIGHFHEQKTNVGHQWCAAMQKRGYRFIHHPDWHGRHIGKYASYHYKKQQFDPVTGLWLDKDTNAALSESKA